MGDKSLVVGVWNIHHGGKHFTEERDGWDSRDRVVEIIRSKKLDVVLMQETYSSGEQIAAELGYYFATVSDWDYLNQGANISVLSRYPIGRVRSPKGASFMNVAAEVLLPGGVLVWAMSNWYGMAQFPTVAEFHKVRFEEADRVPVLFGGDFNAVPAADGGQSVAAEYLLSDGFKDAYRMSYPDVEAAVGATHRNGKRIDQLYYKGEGLKHLVTELVNDWPAGFPSDHYLIVSRFRID
ncbi:endonuclease/exonuclease/phosphatase family protein [Rubritalea tangerina]|uniref:Endonuclease/exonuclease/phosphatase family protein n=1 Tax=Rubritalea tangerina TaxID=430798 RepID=A0ABW4Z6F5_9BACT